ncbi:acyl-CoA thioesterase [Waterburya agarophytonicola K14]|uniref:1,4-dihydroxy-2-naphthoyl-CoA hydrolase n=1 Tax=Waterburya agarophytonicola KI4 TaxID=2874699 RepID=A0A964BPF6_9CYAN|nr:thioesterase family protein [Waterburya agarophytonicola]MCC0176985.1 acyl-CoA thioesterase [Waterburya agarophytonicola KI4]
MPFQYSRRIYLADTDAAGVIYFAKGMEICHEAYEESLASSRINLKQIIEEKKIALPIVRGEIDFLRPLFCGDRITINLTTKLINSREFAVNYQIFHVANSDKILVKAKTNHVSIDPAKRIRIDLPTAILNWLEAYEIEN